MDIINYDLKFDILDENFSVKVIELAFDHYDLFITSENFEERRENLFKDFSEIKPSEIKMYIISLIDSIDKLYNNEDKHIEESLKILFSMSDKQIYFYKQMLLQFNEKINKFKLNLLGKAFKNHIIDFSYNFNIRYAETKNEKVDFAIKLIVKFINDNGKEDLVDIELTLNQFYGIFNEFQKIETMIKTLVN